MDEGEGESEHAQEEDEGDKEDENEVEPDDENALQLQQQLQDDPEIKDSIKGFLRSCLGLHTCAYAVYDKIRERLNRGDEANFHILLKDFTPIAREAYIEFLSDCVKENKGVGYVEFQVVNFVHVGLTPSQRGTNSKRPDLTGDDLERFVQQRNTEYASSSISSGHPNYDADAYENVQRQKGKWRNDAYAVDTCFNLQKDKHDRDFGDFNPDEAKKFRDSAWRQVSRVIE
jgi:hypothetical protein